MYKGKLKNIGYVLLHIVFFFKLCLLTACSFTYSFQGGNLNYNVLKTITIRNFSNKATLVYPPLFQLFEEILHKKYVEQTHLILIPNNGNIEIEGEIISYNVQSIAVKENAFASQIKLSIGVKVKYINHIESNKDIEQVFLASRQCNIEHWDEMQNDLVREIVNELVDMIYNATVANW